MNKNIDIFSIMEKSNHNHEIREQGGATFCPVCGELLNAWSGGWQSPTQKSHFLSNDKINNKMYGKAIIDHRFNWALCCSLKCNNAVQVKRHNTELSNYIVKKIRNDLNK